MGATQISINSRMDLKNWYFHRILQYINDKEQTRNEHNDMGESHKLFDVERKKPKKPDTEDDVPYSCMYIMYKMGNSLALQCFHCRGHKFDPWSGNQDPASHLTQQINFKKYKAVKMNLMLYGLEQQLPFRAEYCCAWRRYEEASAKWQLVLYLDVCANPTTACTL